MQQLRFVMVAVCIDRSMQWCSMQSRAQSSTKPLTTVHNHIKQAEAYTARNLIIYIVSHKVIFVNIGIRLHVHRTKSTLKR